MKRRVFALLIFWLVPRRLVHAQGDPAEEGPLEGVVQVRAGSGGWKSILVAACLLCCVIGGEHGAAAQGLPLPGRSTPTIDAPVTDEAGVLMHEEALSRKLRDYHAQKGLQMAVLVVRTTLGEPIEDYALRVATQWGGGSAERNDGVLFVLAINDRRMRLEVGYGLEDTITDARAARLLERAKPMLRARDYDGAVDEVVSGVFAYHGGEALVPTNRETLKDPTFGLVYGLSGFLGILAGYLWGRRRRRHATREFEAEVELSEPELDPPFEVWGGRLLVPFAAIVAATVFIFDLDVILVAIYGLFFLAGWASDFWSETSFGWVLMFWLVLMVLYFAGLVILVEDGADMPLIVLALAHIFGAAVITVFFRGIGEGGGFGDGGSYSSSSSSWSSGSFSSSSFDFGSSGGGYSGGGGSFGGGGASGSW